ncbi:MAG: Delta(14)-sterol reductase [Chlamydiia bacterium]|nr:Delta(14)-sterol reductase [Chlamydiia bacterium]MCH9616166.1 Delta(14)-sterol reductase [Chlamydiia bacterium]MCH9629848.1 Delta(14)-sterol reductase [Chlamydiia bacterium]
MQKKSYEFGGPIGNVCIILMSHALVYYLWLSLTYYQGSLFLPNTETLHFLKTGAALSWKASLIYFGFVGYQFFLAYIMPGITVKGLPVPSENNRQRSYLCNGIGSWYVTISVAFLLHWTGLFRLSLLWENMGSMITIGMIFANCFTLWLNIYGRITNTETDPSGNRIYDFFMGTMLNPRIGRVDLKMFSEIRVPWILLFFLTLSAAAKQMEMTGSISLPMAFMILAHGLYTNACMKGEECIPTTWDIFYEKFGWMLIFWNYVGVPFVYCFQSFYILQNNPQIPLYFMVPLFALLLIAYYIWDTANSQKNRFRMQLRGTFVERRTFPQLPWGTLKNPKYIETESGSKLLVDGWYRYARKIHYTADSTMALSWALSCGVGGILPYLYPAFFITMIAHRYHRDKARCAKKYGKDWERYTEKVPYKFIPYIY